MKKGKAKKRLRRNKGRHSKINKNCPFLGGKLFLVEARKGKQKKQNKKTPTKKGGFRAK